MQSLKQFIAFNRVRFSCEMVDHNPNAGDDDWAKTATHWKCVLRVGRKSMTVYFSQGPAVCREPTAEDVLDCLASDASGFKNSRSFEDWCGDYGYDTDSRKAERTYRTIEKQAGKLRDLLGSSYEALLCNTERL